MARKRLKKKVAHPSGRPQREAVHGTDRFSPPPRQRVTRLAKRMFGHGMR